MSNQRYSPEFKDEAVRQIVDRGYSVTEVSQRLGVSPHSLYKWVKAVRPDKTEEHAAALIEARSEVLKLRAHSHFGNRLQSRRISRHEICHWQITGSLAITRKVSVYTSLDSNQVTLGGIKESNDYALLRKTN